MIKYLILIFIPIFLYSCNDYKCENTKELSLGVFESIKNLQENDINWYKKRLVNKQDLQVFSNQKGIPDSVKKYIKDSLTDYRINNEIEKAYNVLKQEILDNDIVSNKIEYIDFTIEIDNENEIEGYKGILYFSFNDKIYLTDFIGFKIDNYYKIWDIKNIRKKIK